MEEYKPQEQRKIEVELDKLEKALIVYDRSTDTLHINLSDEDADEVVLFENGIIVRIKSRTLIGLSIQGMTRYG